MPKRSPIGQILMVVVVLLAAAWTGTAVWYQTAPPLRWLWLSLIAALAIVIIGLGTRRRGAAWMLLAVGMVAVMVWWGSIKPSNDRDWIPEIAHGVTATVDGPAVVLSNVRNFDWRTEEDFTQRWETRRYSLDRLNSVDLFTSVWDSPAIAHTLIGFGFSDGQRVVFSAEVRRERNELFSEIGGFFKQFELVMIAADEHDIIRLRTNARRESVSLFPLRVSAEQARALFMTYVNKSNALARQPQFYQTIMSNCTTIIFELARLVDSRIPMDWRILLSGYLPDYLYAHELIRTDLPLPEVKRQAAISRRAQEADPTANYSDVIRLMPSR